MSRARVAEVELPGTSVAEQSARRQVIQTGITPRTSGITTENAEGLQRGGGQKERPSGDAFEGRAEDGRGRRAVRLDERRHGLRTHPDHVRRPDQPAVRVGDQVAGGLDATEDCRGPSRGGTCSSIREGDRRASEGGGDDATGVRANQHDRDSTARPGGVDDAPHAGHAIRVGDGGASVNDDDDGSDSHGRHAT